MRTLVLGGTVFVGRALTEALLARGHEVVHFNRGRSGSADPRVQAITGDRENEADLARLEGRWDAVIDTCGYLPQVVAKSVAALSQVPRYVFVSSISVYAGPSCDEDSALLEPPDPLPSERDPETYGGCKTGCERVVQAAFGPRATIVRPGLIVGPGDYTDRFTWWVARTALGGAIAAPGRRERPIQCIDVRDLGEFLAHLATHDVGGAYNATGPRESLSMGEFLEACRTVSGSDARFHWIPEAALAAAKVAPWSEMPLWLPEDDPIARLLRAPIDRALAAGVAFRPIEDTVRDTLAWERTRGADHTWKAGMARDREAMLLHEISA